jgi:hypothetical protein
VIPKLVSGRLLVKQEFYDSNQPRYQVYDWATRKVVHEFSPDAGQNVKVLKCGLLMIGGRKVKFVDLRTLNEFAPELWEDPESVVSEVPLDSRYTWIDGFRDLVVFDRESRRLIHPEPAANHFVLRASGLDGPSELIDYDFNMGTAAIHDFESGTRTAVLIPAGESVFPSKPPLTAQVRNTRFHGRLLGLYGGDGELVLLQQVATAGKPKTWTQYKHIKIPLMERFEDLWERPDGSLIATFRVADDKVEVLQIFGEVP